MKLSNLFKIVAAMSLAVMFACGGAQTSGPAANEAPDWYDNPTKGCSVGVAKLRANRQMAMDSAMTSARAELARNLQTVIQGMVKRYMAEGEADGKDFAEELSTDVVRDVVDQTLVGTRKAISKTVGNELFVMVCLDPETFADAFERMSKLSGSQRAALKARAEAEFKDLDEQLAKLKDHE